MIVCVSSEYQERRQRRRRRTERSAGAVAGWAVALCGARVVAGARATAAKRV